MAQISKTSATITLVLTLILLASAGWLIWSLFQPSAHSGQATSPSPTPAPNTFNIDDQLNQLQ